MPFDWQAEFPPLATPAATTVRAQSNPPVAASFAQILSASKPTSSNDDLPQPSIRGETLSIKISQGMYEKGMAFCKRNLRGRLVLNKGDKPYAKRDIELKLQKLWKTSGAWSLLSLGRGYYEFYFASEEDLRSVWAMGTVNLKPGLLRLFEWSKDFNLYTQRNTHAQVWIRLMALPQEYWMDMTLREISSVIGTPVLIDNATSKRLFGHYARILVDMDFNRKLFYEIVVEREGFAFPVEVVYERMPDFCTHCQNIGHHISVCRWIHPRKEKENNTEKEKVAQGKKQMPTQRTEWVPLKDNPSGIGSSAAFQQPISRPAATEEAIPTQHSSLIPTELTNLQSQPQQQLYRPTSAAKTLPLQNSSQQHVPSEVENLQTFKTSQQQPTSESGYQFH